MKKSNLNPHKLWLLFVFIAFSAIIINSCKKDNHTTQQAQTLEPALAQAKSWYESNYPANTNKLNTQAIGSSADYSRFVSPDWKHPATYTRFEDDVIEMPLDKSVSAKMAVALKSDAAGDPGYDPAYSHSSFLLLKHLGKYQGYIMTIIADPLYLKNDLSKLDRNKYNKRDSDFSGVVLYSTPKGKFINAWFYKSGTITGRLSPEGSSPADSTSGRQTAVQDVKTNKIITITTCKVWYQTTTFEGVTSELVYLGTSCVTTTVDDGNNGSSGGGVTAPGGGSSSGGGSAPSNPCITGSQNPASAPKVTVNGVKVQYVQPPPPVDGGTGYPPPSGTIPCPASPTAVTIVAPNPVKPCALKFKNITSTYMAVAVTGYKFGITDNVFGTKFITFNVQVGMPNYVNLAKAQNATAAAMLVAEATIAQTHGVDFFLSAGAQGTYFKEFASIVQTELTTALGTKVNVSNAISAGTPIITYADNNCD